MQGKMLPHRIGYCLGLKAVRGLAKSHPLAEMVSWGEPEYAKQLKAVLTEIVEAP